MQSNLGLPLVTQQHDKEDPKVPAIKAHSSSHVRGPSPMHGCLFAKPRWPYCFSFLGSVARPVFCMFSVFSLPRRTLAPIIHEALACTYVASVPRAHKKTAPHLRCEDEISDSLHAQLFIPTVVSHLP